MRDAFANVVREGTGFCAAIPGYEVAGKTGTVRKRTASGYNGGYYASFVGFAPADAPRLAAIVVLDDPAGQYGNVAAAPVFSRIMTTALGRVGARSPIGDQAAATQFAAARATHRSGCVVPPRPTAAEAAAAAGDQSGETPAAQPTTKPQQTTTPKPSAAATKSKPTATPRSATATRSSVPPAG
jgi:membrane peptidoglycan carboxypeptidase